MATKSDPGVDAYIAGFPEAVRTRLEQVRQIVHEAVPDAEERISYGVAGYRVRGKMRLFFAGWPAFVSVYPVHEVPEEIAAEIATRKSGTATVRFPHSEPLPLDLIRRLVPVIAAREGDGL
jgi:uncharacterized protein YdhG (YjbR/CyaY superfamily)